MDTRIGKLNSGTFYAYPNGYDTTAVYGTLNEVNQALGLPVEKETVQSTPAPQKRRDQSGVYLVTIITAGQTEEREIWAPTRGKAISEARAYYQSEYACIGNPLPAKYRARKIIDEIN